MNEVKGTSVRSRDELERSVLGDLTREKMVKICQAVKPR